MNTIVPTVRRSMKLTVAVTAHLRIAPTAMSKSEPPIVIAQTYPSRNGAKRGELGLALEEMIGYRQELPRSSARRRSRSGSVVATRGAYAQRRHRGKRRSRSAARVAQLPRHLARHLSLADRLALVVEVLAARQGQLHLRP